MKRAKHIVDRDKCIAPMFFKQVLNLYYWHATKYVSQAQYKRRHQQMKTLSTCKKPLPLAFGTSFKTDIVKKCSFHLTQMILTCPQKKKRHVNSVFSSRYIFFRAKLLNKHVSSVICLPQREKLNTFFVSENTTGRRIMHMAVIFHMITMF